MEKKTQLAMMEATAARWLRPLGNEELLKGALDLSGSVTTEESQGSEIPDPRYEGIESVACN